MEPRTGAIDNDDSILEPLCDVQGGVEIHASGNPEDNLSPGIEANYPLTSATQEVVPDLEPAPEGWLTISALSKTLRMGPVATRELIEEIIEDRPDWVGNMRSKTIPATHYHPDAVAILVEKRVVELPPEGWRPKQSIVDVIGGSKKVVDEIIDEYREEHPSWFGEFKDKSGHVREHFDPQLLENINADHSARLVAVPEGWMTAAALCDEVGYSDTSIRKAAKQLAKDHPEWTTSYKLERGPIVVHYHPDLVGQIRKSLGGDRTPAPEGWMTTNALATELQVDNGTIEKLAKGYPGLESAVVPYVDKVGKIVPHYHPDLVDQIHKDLSRREFAPEGWMTTSAIATELGMSFSAVSKITARLQGERSDWSHAYSGKGMSINTHYHPDLVNIVRAEIAGYEDADNSWLTARELAEEVGISGGTVGKLLGDYREDEPAYFKHLKGKTGRISEHFSREMVEVIKQRIGERTTPPSGWQTASALSNEIGIDHRSLKNIAKRYRDEHPDWFGLHKDSVGKVVEHYHPELLSELTGVALATAGFKSDQITRRAKEAQLKQDIKDFLVDIEEGDSLEAQEFKRFIHLFGGERVVDIFYRFMPGAKGKVEVPFITSMLADYLGDTLVVKGEFSPETLEKGVGLLSDETFKVGLTEVLIKECLGTLNKLGREDFGAISINTVLDYLDHIRQETAQFSTENLEEILGDVEAYYQLLFENVHKPARFIDQLHEGRLFPDINQRINVQEIAFKRKVLLGDEMGTGKTGSTIMAKEILGVKQALVVAPSNVLDVWVQYLNTYFKEGESPSYIIIDNPHALDDVDSSAYQYVLISQERLKEDYMPMLRKLDYDMLAVDEIHKLKNLGAGVRAEHLVELADRIQEDDQYLVLLSGTPVPNKIQDIAISLRLLYPERFKDIENKELISQILNGDMLDLRSLLVPRMQMKTLAETIEMPELTEELHYIEMSKGLQEAYAIIVDDEDLSANAKIEAMRKLLMNPHLLDATPDIENSKLQAVKEAMRQTFAAKDKAVMFVNGYIEDVIRGEKSIIQQLDLPDDVDVFVIHGDTDKEERLLIQEELKAQGGRVLLVVSGQTADVGVDFSAAEEVYFYNEPWTEYDKKQQLGRVYRPGLKDDLKVHTFIMKGTIEEGIHKYIKAKHQVVEKLLRGIPLAEVERELLRSSEKQVDPELEVNKDLAEYYFSSWDKMMNIYKYVKNIGEEDFLRFLDTWGMEYADCYANLVGSRSYQANVGRLSGTLIDVFAKERSQKPEDLVILDVASGPEMLKQHIGEEYSHKVLSLDANHHHFKEVNGKQIAGSFVRLPVADESVDYANLSLSIHYSGYFAPKPKGGEPDIKPEVKYERIEVLRELNRVLRKNGRAIIPMIYSLKFEDDKLFRDAIDKLGFRIIDNYSSDAASGRNFQTQVITLEKIKTPEQRTPEIAKNMTAPIQRALKFKKVATKLRDSRKIVTHFIIGNSTLKAKLNSTDEDALVEEQQILGTMENLKHQYGTVKDIPKESILAYGYSRIFYGKKYVLFKQLESGSGAVIIR